WVAANPWVMIDDLRGNAQLRPSRQGFAATQIAGKTWVGAAGNLDAKTFSLSEVVGSWPEFDGKAQAAIRFRGDAPRGQAHHAITEIDGAARSFHEAEPHEEVGMLQAGTHIDLGFDRTDHLQIVRQLRARIHQHISSCLQISIVLWSHPL